MLYAISIHDKLTISTPFGFFFNMLINLHKEKMGDDIRKFQNFLTVTITMSSASLKS